MTKSKTTLAYDFPFKPISPKEDGVKPSRPGMRKVLGALDLPRLYLVRMLVFLAFVGLGVGVAFDPLRAAWSQNIGLNSAIFVILFLGASYTFRMVWRLFPEIRWVNRYRIADPGLELSSPPKLLAPMATLLRDRRGPTVLTPVSMRSLLDSLASRLDETRDMSRYLIGLLIFMGLLGTFWGLLQTVHAVSEAIAALDITTQSGHVFEELKRGLTAPLSGMGTSFSSSLFGLSGSLILGFLDLQAGQAQNRFYHDLEEWLSGMTDLGGESTFESSHSRGRLELEQTLHAFQTVLHEERASAQRVFAHMNETLGVFQSQGREEHEMIRQWFQMHAQNQKEWIEHLQELRIRGGASPHSSEEQKEKTP